MRLPLARAEIKKEHTEQHQQQIDGFTSEILLVEQQGAGGESDEYAASPDHRNDRDHRVGKT